MKKAIQISVFLVLLLFIILGGVFVQGKAIEANAPEQQKYYTTVQLQEGESLWEIAARTGSGFEALLRENPQICWPNWLSAGEEVRLP